MEFELISPINEIKTIAFNCGIRELARLKKLYGKGRWRKLKGVAIVKLQNGRTC